MILVMAHVLVFAAMIVATLLSGDRSVFFSRDGVSLPFFLLPIALPRAQMSWSSLVAVKFQPKDNSGFLRLYFGGGKTVVFDLAELKPDQVEQIIVALDVWSQGTDRFPALMEARLHLSGQHTMPSLSYTNMWEEELARRFGATNFIPLEPQHKLRDGGITIERQLAFGGSSAIYLVRDKNNAKFVLKEAVVPADADAELRNKSVEMLRREAGYLSRLQHPCLSRVLEYFVEDDRHYLLMDYMDGIDLRRLVREKSRPTIAEAMKYAREIAGILAFLHDQEPPIVHRDLTPDNIILREDGTIAVIDFGAANNFIGTATHTLIGKQSYMPPEQLRGKTEQRSDIYAFGATLYFLLTGEDPEPISTLHPRQANSGVPEEIDALVAWCTELEIVDRPASIKDVAKKLQEAPIYV